MKTETENKQDEAPNSSAVRDCPDSAGSVWVTSVLLKKIEGQQLYMKLAMSKDECATEEEALGRAIKHWEKDAPEYTIAQTLAMEIPSQNTPVEESAKDKKS